ncbi:MAG: hypothetical protein KKB51_09525 [Candidatus Riflebacteria bacterium]|nr:hypothetical protein [Candidatus Riflebacteria bacterium]
MIVCRNVAIYFSLKLREELFGKITSILSLLDFC